jgi:hypothetical protein
LSLGTSVTPVTEAAKGAEGAAGRGGDEGPRRSPARAERHLKGTEHGAKSKTERSPVLAAVVVA